MEGVAAAGMPATERGPGPREGARARSLPPPGTTTVPCRRAPSTEDHDSGRGAAVLGGTAALGRWAPASGEGCDVDARMANIPTSITSPPRCRSSLFTSDTLIRFKEVASFAALKSHGAGAASLGPRGDG